MQLNNKWQQYFGRIVEAVKTGSKDPSIQHGALVYRPDKTIAGTGFNGFPAAIPDNPQAYTIREIKLRRIVHAEANCLDHTFERIDGFGMVVTGTPCSECAKRIINRGIAIVYHLPDEPAFAERWKNEIIVSKQLLHLAKVPLVQITPEPLSTCNVG